MAILVTAAAITLPAAASAHVTLQPNEAPAGAFKRLDVRVPNELDDASTTKVQLQLPPGFVFASYEAVAGWKVSVKKEKLAKPVKTDDGELTEQVREITWTGNGKAGKVGPGTFQDFGLSVQIPEKKAGSDLTFKAIQTYDNGEVVRWIGPPDAEEPAPQVMVTAAEEEGRGNKGAADVQPAAATTQAGDGGDDGAGGWVARRRTA